MVGLASKSCEIVRAAKGGNCSLGVGHSFGCAGSEVWVAPGCGGTFAIGGKRLHCSAVHAHTQARCAALDSSRPLTIAVGICPRPAHHLCMIILSAMAGSRYIGGGVAIATPVASNHAQPVSSTFWPMQPLLRQGFRPPLRSHAFARLACGDADVYAQIDFVARDLCLLPQITHLQSLVSLLPHACFILNTRPLNHWLGSVRDWGTHWGKKYNPLMQRFAKACPLWPRNETGLARWVEEHHARAREVLATAPCAIELNMLSRNPPLTSSRTRCWGRSNPGVFNEGGHNPRP